MQEESEISRRRRILSEHEEALRGLQALSRAANAPLSKLTASRRAPVDKQTTQPSHASSAMPPSSATSSQSPPPGSRVSAASYAEVITPPPTITRPHDDVRAVVRTVSLEGKEALRAELQGEDGYVPDLKRLSMADETANTDEFAESAMHQGSGKDKNSPLSYQCSVSDEQVTESRCVTAIKFHQKYDDVVLTAHSHRADRKIGESAGIVALWGLDGGRASLQRSLTSNSPVTALELFSLSPKLVVGGTRCGDVLVWDTRVKTALPINTLGGDPSDVSSKHGRRSVAAIKTTSTPSSVFFSASASGHLCKWSLSRPESPISRGIVQDATGASELMMTCLDFSQTARFSADDRGPVNRNASIIVGSLDGGIYRVDGSRHSWGLDAGRGVHEASVTAISSHPFGDRNPYLDNIIVSASRDWTVRLWHYARGKQCKELISFNMVATGTVHDVEWSPQYPTVCCSGDEAGVLSLIDVSGHLSPKQGAAFCQFSVPKRDKPAAITKVQWGNNGKNICAGDQQGKISIWSCEAAFAALPGSDWTAQYMKAKFAKDP